MLSRRLVCSLAIVLTSIVASAQDDDVIARAKAAEAKRVALVARLAPAVGSFFQGDAVGHGGGSGVLIDPRGYALTNFHVTAVAPTMTVGLNDGKTYHAVVLGIDPGGDISLVKLEGRPSFPWVPLGVSDDIKPGDRVLAMGNPFLLATDFSPTVTEGIVSGVHRFRDAAGGADLVYGDCIQIDASINPGNSGGPLFDEAGRLLGINGLGGFRPDRGRVNVGVGYAASIDQIKGFISDLRAGRQCEHGTMDASVRDLPLPDAPDVTRPVVDAIVNDSVAWNAGLRLGDVLIDLDGIPIHTQNRFLTLISRLPAGRRVTLKILHPLDGKSIEKTVTFRLKGVPSGPDKGKWQADPEASGAERDLVIAEYRRARGTANPEAFRRAGTRVAADGSRRSFALAVKGKKARLELGSGDAMVVLATDGVKGWLQKEGKVEDAPAAMLDELLGDAIALDALAREGGEKDLKEIAYTGGDAIGGRLVDRLETRDQAGRKRKVYVDVATRALAGIARESAARDRDGNVRWVEEQRFDKKIVRVYDDDATPIDEDRIDKVEPFDGTDALFERPGGGK